MRSEGVKCEEWGVRSEGAREQGLQIFKYCKRCMVASVAGVAWYLQLHADCVVRGLELKLSDGHVVAG